MTKKLLFFSRGKGRGHAVPDIAIAEDLKKRNPSVDIGFVSYSTGAEVIKAAGWSVLDLGVREDCPLPDLTYHAARILRAAKPDLVVSHEEFAVPPVAKAAGVPVVFLTDWFLPADAMPMQCLRFADEIIFLDERGIYDEPVYLAGKVTYSGYVLRTMGTEGLDRSRARTQRGLSQDAAVVLVVPGGAGFHSEERAPILDLVLGAFGLVQAKPKRLVWVAGGGDHDLLGLKTRHRDDVTVMRPHADFTATIAAADVVISKGNRLPLFECEVLGIPSISLSSGHNPIDDIRAARIRGNTALRVRGMDAPSLCHCIESAIAHQPPRDVSREQSMLRRRMEVAARLERHLSRS